MSDVTESPKGGIAKATASGIYFMLCQNITPSIVGYLLIKIPFITESTMFEMVVFSLGTLGSFMVWLTPTHLVDSIASAIVFCKSAIKKWKDAANQP